MPNVKLERGAPVAPATVANGGNGRLEIVGNHGSDAHVVRQFSQGLSKQHIEGRTLATISVAVNILE